MGLDPQKGFAKMYEDSGVEDTVGVEVEVLDAVVPQLPLEEVARRERQSVLREPCKHQDLVRIFLHGVRIPGGGSTSFSRRNPLLRRASKSSVFALDFFHSRFGSGRGEDTGSDVLAADPAASSRAVFFPPAAFVVFDGDGFILQVHGVFTRIRSGANVVSSYGGALGSALHSMAAVRTSGDSWLDLLGMTAAV
jgi:hypothetical protein